MNGDVWYLDTSAFVKLIETEPESGALSVWLAEGRRRASSDLLRTEALRAARRAGAAAVERCRALLGTLPLIRVDATVFDAAGSLGPSDLRSLDAIHLAAALSLGSDLAGVVTYDRQMAMGARVLGVAVASPSALGG